MILIESAGITDRGRKRQANEDALFLEDAMGLYVVADGMGGHLAGEVASRMVVETIGDYIRSCQENAENETPIYCNQTLSKEANRLMSGIHLSNRAVHEAARDNKSYRGMGSTVSAVYFTDGTLIAANVGDSPIYLIRDGQIQLLSVPHTVMAEQSALDPANAEKLGMEFRHVLTRAMGTEESVKADIYEIECFRDDILVISSDGLSDKASPEEIKALVDGNGSDAACRRLVDLANNRGGDDNITAIVLKIKKVNNTPLKFKRMVAMAKRIFYKYTNKFKI
ncbi:MAG: serine/threonine-protein phosphatase [Deltaproteobacteria bacterium]|jgi:protein phosphatase|nr:serine/threonine-protein phosphatase [Deltaproteobacteria bacterium]MBW2481995.1 serine/threonine-protein phosphatase [Deltaproteobacteria bacterium]